MSSRFSSTAVGARTKALSQAHTAVRPVIHLLLPARLSPLLLIFAVLPLLHCIFLSDLHIGNLNTDKEIQIYFDH